MSDSAGSRRNEPALPSGWRGRLRSPQDLAGGFFMLAISALAFWQSDDLTLGTLRAFGPGMMPQLLSALCAICGMAILVGGLVRPGPALERWTWRGPLFVLGGAIVFGLTIRPLGLAVAAPLALVLSSYASAETKLKETLIFGIAMTVFCIGLFKLLLGLPVPVAPWAGF